jgi:hypothetical protein
MKAHRSMVVLHDTGNGAFWNTRRMNLWIYKVENIHKRSSATLYESMVNLQAFEV